MTLGGFALNSLNTIDDMVESLLHGAVLIDNNIQKINMRYCVANLLKLHHVKPTNATGESGDVRGKER
jgi:hypothetical protein